MKDALNKKVQQLCHGVDEIAMALLERELLTINLFHPEQMELERLFSSNPQAYPTGGRKQKRGTAWGQHVLIDQKVFVGEGIDAIRQSFDDHETITRLGLQSIINIPITSDTHCLGTLNILMKHPKIRTEHIDTARQLGTLLRTGLLDLHCNTPK
ncbi:GAF domain-containing protein [Zwartia vadi]|uniref:GAF domain-containing protein n=1 Tax=Zwartia vadi TaxID=3058168 RepID=UPI0025B4B897|nr:GAF domain-containing protein [Zwartia vadi]MDN3987601.1 GAF domain-containing protein [Zwartia vadi]